jgi:hypothetical protein
MSFRYEKIARRNRLASIVEMTDQVLELFDLWEAYIDFRNAEIESMKPHEPNALPKSNP